jgi:hypothetical protein
MVRLLAAVRRLHCDSLRGVIDALHHDDTRFQTVLADVIDLFSRLRGALHRVMHDDFIAFLQAEKHAYAMTSRSSQGATVDRVRHPRRCFRQPYPRSWRHTHRCRGVPTALRRASLH